MRHAGLGLLASMVLMCVVAGCGKHPAPPKAKEPGETFPLPPPGAIRTLSVVGPHSMSGRRPVECPAPDRHGIDLAMAILMEHPSDWHHIYHDLGPSDGVVTFYQGPGKPMMILWIWPDRIGGGINTRGVVEDMYYLDLDKQTLKEFRDAVGFDRCGRF